MMTNELLNPGPERRYTVKTVRFPSQLSLIARHHLSLLPAFDLSHSLLRSPALAMYTWASAVSRKQYACR